LLALGFLVGFTACGGDDGGARATSTTSTSSTLETCTESRTKPTVDVPATAPTSLVSKDLIAGHGPAIAAGARIAVHYVGVSFSTGEQFDASWDRGQPFEFKLGKGQVIPGWDQGVAGMKVGGRRRLTIPSAMAYGARGAGGVIKPHEPLIFVVDLLAVD
jgi:peptidylprolyl isomerase